MFSLAPRPKCAEKNTQAMPGAWIEDQGEGLSSKVGWSLFVSPLAGGQGREKMNIE